MENRCVYDFDETYSLRGCSQPFEIAFLKQKVDALFWWNRWVDTLFLVDMFFNFMTPYQDAEKGQIVYDSTLIVKRYLKGKVVYLYHVIFVYD